MPLTAQSTLPSVFLLPLRKSGMNSPVLLLCSTPSPHLSHVRILPSACGIVENSLAPTPSECFLLERHTKHMRTLGLALACCPSSPPRARGFFGGFSGWWTRPAKFFLAAAIFLCSLRFLLAMSGPALLAFPPVSGGGPHWYTFWRAVAGVAPIGTLLDPISTPNCYIHTTDAHVVISSTMS